jgi:hypothetical protein
MHDGKFLYCFSNEHWSASSKDVSFNVHGIVYVPEAEAPSDPLEAEGITPPPSHLDCTEATTDILPYSTSTVRITFPGQG